MASVMERVLLGLMSRIWCGRERGGEAMGGEKGDLALVGRVVPTPLPAVGIDGAALGPGPPRDAGRDDGPACPECCANRGWAGCCGGEIGIDMGIAIE